MKKGLIFINGFSLTQSQKHQADKISHALIGLGVDVKIIKGNSLPAYIDGEKTEVFNANVMYSGVRVGGGSHTVTLRYKTPFSTLGAVCSLVGVLACACLVAFPYFVEKRKKSAAEKHQNQND